MDMYKGSGGQVKGVFATVKKNVLEEKKMTCDRIELAQQSNRPK